jgi:hypothetical protein
LKQAQWVDARAKDLLPIPYFHVVPTVPRELHPLFLTSRKAAYDCLFAAAAETLLEVSKRRLKAKVGILAVLHTWTQTLLYHPHVHCIVTGGGLSLDGQEWKACKPSFFIAKRVLAEVFRGKVLNKLERALEKGELHFDLADGKRHLLRAARKRWVVDVRAPFAGPEVFLKYISRYVHRVAIDDRRLVAYDGRRVTFQYRDRRHGNVVRTTSLGATVFLRRFLLHLLPKNFFKIRSYGLLANSVKKKNLARCRELLGPMPAPKPEAEPDSLTGDSDAEPNGYTCPKCSARLVRTGELPPEPQDSPPTPAERPP